MLNQHKEMDHWRLVYKSQKGNAKRRRIEWRIDFNEWMKVWLDSGHIHQRGRGRAQYVMSRPGDAGPYSAENVSIIPKGDNDREAHCGKPGGMRGKHLTDEHKRWLSEWAKSRVQPVVQCPHCHKSGQRQVMGRWHMDNCRRRAQ